MRRFHRLQRDFAAAVAVLAGLIWSWFDTRTLLGPEGLGAARWRIAALAVMLGSAFLAWSRSHGGD